MLSQQHIIFSHFTCTPTVFTLAPSYDCPHIFCRVVRVGVGVPTASNTNPLNSKPSNQANSEPSITTKHNPTVPTTTKLCPTTTKPSTTININLVGGEEGDGVFSGLLVCRPLRVLHFCSEAMDESVGLVRGQIGTEVEDFPGIGSGSLAPSRYYISDERNHLCVYS